MPITINKPALKSLTDQLINRHQQDPNVKIDAKVLDQIVSIVGDDQSTNSASIADQLKNSQLSAQEKLALAKNGMNAQEKADIKAIIGDSQLSALLDPISANFLKALVGLEPLKAVDQLGGTAPVQAVAQSPAVEAVKKFKSLVKSGKINTYYDAAIGIGNADLKDEAMKLFESLPKITPETTADDFVALGLWTTKPRGFEAMQKSARFLPGRQVLVPCTINANTSAGNKFLTYQEGGVQGKTYRATLAGEKGDNYLVKVDGKAEPIEIPKAKVHELNQPHQFSGDSIKLAKTVDYKSPFMKAKIAEAAIKMDELVGKLDFTKKTTDSGNSLLSFFSRGGGSKKTSEIQRQCVKIVHDVIDMLYPKGDIYNRPGRYSGSDAGRLAVKGVGSCFMQASVMAGVLAPFGATLGVDTQFISGGVYRNVKSSDTPEAQYRRFSGAAHGWLQLTYRPSMELRICDRTWSQSDHPADKAYSRWGDRYPSGSYWGLKPAPVTGTDVNMSGDVSVSTFDRQFGTEGSDGRDNHMSLTQ
jgi:hypothetical protein